MRVEPAAVTGRSRGNFIEQGRTPRHPCHKRAGGIQERGRETGVTGPTRLQRMYGGDHGRQEAFDDAVQADPGLRKEASG